jgi:hypothetical protein
MPSFPKRPLTIIIYYRKKYNYFHQNNLNSGNSSAFGFLLQAASQAKIHAGSITAMAEHLL